MIAAQIYEIKPGVWGYKILDDDSPFIIQEFHPNTEGFQEMSFEIAKAESEKTMLNLNKNGVD